MTENSYIKRRVKNKSYVSRKAGLGRNYPFLIFSVLLFFVFVPFSCKVTKEECLSIQGKVTPIMGWSSWNHFAVHISDTLIRQQADAMISSGMKEAGYRFINIDDGYFGGRTEEGLLYSDSLKFPFGMKALADYIHAKGLKAGIYSDAGRNTCGSKFNNDKNGIGVGLYGYDRQDIDLLLSQWDYDFIKVDFCGGLWLGLDEETRYTEIKQAVDNIDKDVVYNVCRWEFPGTWAPSISNSWRISQDISPSFKSILSIIDKNTYLAQYASPGHFNDMDMLQVGRGMSYEEDKTHFSMWSIMCSPLLAGNDLRNMSKETLEILTNEEIIALNQDTAGIQARKIRDYGDSEVWVKPLGNRQSPVKAVALLNRSDTIAEIKVDWKDLGIKGRATVRDLWEHKEKGEYDEYYGSPVPPHGVVMLKVSATQTLPEKIYEAEYSFMNSFPKENKATYAYLDNSPEIIVAKDIGNNPDNWIEFRDIFVEKEGDYELTLYYSSQNSGDISVAVNKNDLFEINGLKSAKIGEINNVKQKVRLKKGYNVIRLFNSDSWAPDIDKIAIDKI